MKWPAVILIIAAAGFAGAALGRASAPDPEVARLEAAVDTARSASAAAAETVTVYVPIAKASKARSDSADQMVTIADDTTLQVRITPRAPPSTVIVPVQVVADLTQLRQTVADQAKAIEVLEAKVGADSILIIRQDSLIQAQRPPRCGAKCGGGIVAALAGLIALIAR